MNRWMTIWATFSTILLVCTCVKGATPRGSVREIACALTNHNAAAALIESAIWVTIDGGIIWKQVARLPNLHPIQSREPTPVTPVEKNESSLENTPRERRLSWESPNENTDLASSDPLPGASARNLAVGDDGTWAVSSQGSLFIGGPLAGIRRHIKLAGIRGLLIDREGGLWVTVKDAVIFLAKSTDGFKGKKQFKLPGAGAPVPSTEPAALLIPGRAGLWVVSLSGKEKETLIGPYPMPAIDAVAAAPGSDLLYAVSLGRLKKLSLASSKSPTYRKEKKQERSSLSTGHMQVQDIGPTPAPVSRLLVDQNGHIYAFTGRSGWFDRAGDTWRPIRVRALAVDAIGRLWSGTDYGPVPPESDTQIEAVDSPQGARFTNVLNATISKSSRWPGEPRCRQLPLNPLPVSRGFFSFGRNGSQHREAPLLPTGARHEAWFYIGIQFTWHFDPLTHWRCLPQQVRFLALRNQRIQEVEVLWKSLQRASMQHKAATDVLQAAFYHLDGQQLKELIRIKSGTYPTEEEK